MQLSTSVRLQGIGEYYFSGKLREIDQLNQQGKAIINLGIGSPDLPPHPSVIKTLEEAAAKPQVHGYQNYKGLPALRQAMADWYLRSYGVTLNPDRQILPLMGSKEGIMHICMTYLNPGDEALIPNPGYPTYSSAVKLSGGTPVTYQLTEQHNWEPDWDALEKLDLSKVKLMWVNYPHMPTGQSATPQLFEKLIAFAHQHQILICHDNPYSFILNDHPVSILQTPGALDVAIELNSLSKSHNMAGWRVGMLCGDDERIAEVLTFKSNMDSGMFLPVQMAAVTALGLGTEWQNEVNAIYAARREKVLELLQILGCIPAPDQVGLFIWAAIPEGYESGYELSDRVLYSAGVFITPGGIFGSAGDRYIRVSLCGSVEKFAEAIERIKIHVSGN
ncbi:MAG: aminotransferase class I/II-fold pyridoxal phosphate-dependent enzyme [Chitinophagia bacterium]